MANLLRKGLIILLSALLSFAAYAQVTTSSLGGRVVDASGEPLIGVAVVATHTPSGTKYGTITNEDGRYTIQGMRTGGPYSVEVSCLGYQTMNYTDVTLELAELFSLNATLKDASEQLVESIVVASALSKFAAVEKTGASTNINNTQIEEMPSVSRSITDIAKLSPYGGNGMNLAGGDGRSSNFTVDGADFNNNFGLSSGLPGGGSPISIDAIQEMQVVISPYDVRQTNFIGGGVNAITKSGTNTFKGTAYVYHRNENMHGNRVYNDELAERSIDRKTTYGFTFGGPIVKNKLFFFVNAEYAKIPTQVNLWRATADGVGDPDKYLSRTTIADMERVSDFLKSRYKYDPGSYTNFPANESNAKVLARIDWNIDMNNHLAVRYNYTTNENWMSSNATSADVGSKLAFSRSSQYSMIFSNAMYSMNNNVSTISVDLNSRINDKLSNQLLFTYSKISDVRGSNSSEFPFVDIMEGYEQSASGAITQTLMPYMSFGYELFTWKNAVRNNVWNLKDDITWYYGSHKVTGGLALEHQMALNSYMRNGTGYYRYRSVDDFISGAAPESVAITYGFGGNDSPSAKIRYTKAGLYVQDEWNATEKLKLTYGLRLDDIIYNNADLATNAGIYAFDYNGRHIDTGRWPSATIQISPRVGFSWDVLGNKTLKVRGGTGIFAGRLPLVFLTNMPSNSGMIQNLQVVTTKYKNGVAEWDDGKDGINNKTILDSFIGGLVTDKKDMLEKLRKAAPTRFPESITAEQGSAPSAIQAVDPQFKMPQVWKSSVAVDYTIPVSFPLTVTGEFIFNKTINGVVMKNWDLQDNAGWARFNGADNRHIYPDNYSLGNSTAYMLSNTHKGWGYNYNFQVNARPVENLRLMASYTHSKQREISGMPGSNAASVFTSLPSVDGPNFATLNGSQYVTPDRLIASATWTEKSNHVSLFYEAFRDGGYSYMYDGDLNGDGNNYDLMYIPKNENEIRFASVEDANRFWAFMDQDKYLCSHKGQYAKAYDAASPMVHRLDLRYAHDFTVKVGQSRNTLQLNFDIMNLMNLFNSKWGVLKRGNQDFTDSYSGIRPLTYERTDPDGVPVFSCPIAVGSPTWEPNHSYGQCWYMQIGIKYMFN